MGRRGSGRGKITKKLSTKLMNSLLKHSIEKNLYAKAHISIDMFSYENSHVAFMACGHTCPKTIYVFNFPCWCGVHILVVRSFRRCQMATVLSLSRHHNNEHQTVVYLSKPFGKIETTQNLSYKLSWSMTKHKFQLFCGFRSEASEEFMKTFVKHHWNKFKS